MSYGNTLGRGTQTMGGGGKRIWHDIYHSFPVGGTVKNLSAFAVGSVIPAGSLAIFTLGEVEIVQVPAPYDATQKYALNKEVIKDGVMYKNTTAITTPEAWDASKWTALAAGDNTYDKAAAVNGLTHNDIYIEESTSVATAAVVFAGVVYESRLNYEVPAIVKSNLVEIKSIKEA